MKTSYFLLSATAAFSVAACNPTTGGNATQSGNEAESANAAGTVGGGGAPAANEANAGAAAVASLVTFRGCPIRSDVGAGCITVKSDDGVTYELYSAKPLPDPSQHLIVDGTGTSGGVVSTCMAGTPLSNVEWHYTKMKCG